MKENLTIGNVTLANPLILAPMAGVTDLPFRLLCKEQGAGLLCTEMISAKAILYKNKNTKALMKILRRRSKSIPLISWISIWAVRFPRWSTTGKVPR